jgi:Na+/glutamate symporter
MEWFFEGLGTALISLILGLLTGGTIGYRISIKKTIKVNQKQKAGDNASQIQVGRNHNEK